MKLLWIVSYKQEDSFEKAIFDLPFKNYLDKNKIEYVRYDYYTQEKTLKKFVNEYSKDESFDFIVIPVSENDFQQVDLSNKKANSHTKIIYVVTGEGEKLVDEFAGITLRDAEDTTIVTLEATQGRYLKHTVFTEKVKLNYFVNEYVFEKDNNDYKNKNVDVSFFGSKNKKREKIIQELKNNNINVVCYGDGWEFPRHNLNFQKNVLNRSWLTVVTDNRLKPLHLEAIACGSLPIAKKCAQYIKMFNKIDNLPIYKDEEELVKIVKEYLSNKDKIKQTEILLGITNKKYVSDLFFKRLFKKL
jgi:hypothetical protein